MSTNTCYYYDEQRNRCNCYINENLNELLDENAKLRKLVRELHECAANECKRCHEWHRECYIETDICELGMEVE